MAFGAVSWQYRDVFTSAKAAQMEENVRTHDHRSTDQGATMFPREVASGIERVAVAGSNWSAGTRIDTAITFPAGRFSSAPEVIATFESDSVAQVAERTAVARQVTATGFTLSLYTGAGMMSSGGTDVVWIAVQP